MCFIFIYNAVIWWAFRGVILCYPLTNIYLCVEIYVLMIACIILILQYHILLFHFNRLLELGHYLVISVLIFDLQDLKSYVIFFLWFIWHAIPNLIQSNLMKNLFCYDRCGKHLILQKNFFSFYVNPLSFESCKPTELSGLKYVCTGGKILKSLTVCLY